VQLLEAEQLVESVLTTELMIAARQTISRRLSAARIDRILGVRSQRAPASRPHPHA
jgi:hypothetical protein